MIRPAQFFIVTSLLFMFLAMPVHFILAQTSDPYGLKTTGSAATLAPTTDVDASAQIDKIISNIIRTLLGLTGVLFMGLIIVAGNLWMTAGGNEEQVKKARGMMTSAIIGLLAVLGAYVITNFVVTTILGFVAS